ncbi:MAG: N-acetyltransferase family protein, partial [Halanaeroarchaeum sp.]
DGLLEWYEAEHLRREIRSADSVVAVSEADDELSGFAHAVLDGAEGTVLRLYVRPGERRSGVGTDLVEFTVDELEDRGVDRVFALALARNDVAAEFYDATGFERVGTEKTTIAGERYDELVFRRPI